MPDTPLGRFCWYELMTTDPDRAPDFYGQVAGWGTMPFNGAGEPYTMWTNGATPLGGVMQLPEEAIADGAPPHWLVHLSTPDLAATTAKVKELGGQVLMQMEVPTVGEFALVRDPQGAVVSAYQPTEGAPGHDGPPAIGEFSWHELPTTDWQGAWDFYSGVFGWEKTDAMDMGDMGTYQTFGRGAHPLGGMFNKPAEVPVVAWVMYIHVPNVDAAVEKVKSLGGTVVNGPMEVPGGDMVAHCTDPTGAGFAVHAMAAR